MYFFNKYFYSTKSFGAVIELPLFVHMLLSDQSYTWGSFFLALLYKGMESLLRQIKESEHYANAEDPIWFLQLWGQLYFPNFAFSPSSDPPRVLGMNFASTPTLPVERLEVLQVVFDIVSTNFYWCPVLEENIGP